MTDPVVEIYPMEARLWLQTLPPAEPEIATFAWLSSNRHGAVIARP
jgi:hypothetical protein